MLTCFVAIYRAEKKSSLACETNLEVGKYLHYIVLERILVIFDIIVLTQ